MNHHLRAILGLVNLIPLNQLLLPPRVIREQKETKVSEKQRDLESIPEIYRRMYGELQETGFRGGSNMLVF
jgi:hypothetical protein